ncbi:MAG: PEP-CTERM sorting domain-containing protein, partial [Planctomycetota bacterium]
SDLMKKLLILLALLAAANVATASNINDPEPTDPTIAAAHPEGDFCIEMGIGDMFGGTQDDPINSIYHIDLGSLVDGGAIEITDIAWDVTIQPIGDSWYSDATIGFAVEDGSGLALAPGVGEEFPFDGAAHQYISAPLNLIDAGVGNLNAPSGVFVLTFFDFYDDIPGEADALLLGDSVISVTFDDESGNSHTADIKWAAVPEPGSLGLLLAGFLAMLGIIRRKR